MATIINRGPGQWQAKVRKAGYPTQSKTFETKAAAEDWARRLEVQMSDGAFRGGSKKATLADLAALYIEKGFPGLGDTNIKPTLSRIKNILANPISGRKLNTLIPADFAYYRDGRLDEGYAPSTVTKELNTMSSIYRVAAEFGVVVENPLKGVPRPRATEGRSRRVTDDEVAAIIAHTESPVLPDIIHLALESAMRRGEIAGLMWENVHLSEDAGYAFLPITKNGTSRKVPLSSRARAVFRRIGLRKSGSVFGVRPDSVTTAFDRACERAGISDLVFHDLRHEAATRLSAIAKDALELSAFTGHKDLQSLKRYYHPDPEALSRKLG